SRSEIVKMTCLSKECSAAASGEILFTHPRFEMIIWGLFKKYFHGASRQIIFYRHLILKFREAKFQNEVSLKRIFCRRRRQKSFYTPPD
ncbi:MAG: hypothetical protein ACOYOO_14275, partial [Saprospiraceae bacterium]